MVELIYLNRDHSVIIFSRIQSRIYRSHWISIVRGGICSNCARSIQAPTLINIMNYLGKRMLHLYKQKEGMHPNYTNGNSKE